MERIDVIPWDEDFNTGIDIVDAQHRQLVEVINGLAAQFALTPDQIELSTVFEELIAYTRYHFDSEEYIWQSRLHENQNTQNHREIHQDFIRELRELIALQDDSPVDEVANRTFDFLIEWLISHILISDRHMAYRVAGIESGLSPEAAEREAAMKMESHTRLVTGLIMQLYKTLAHNTIQLMQERGRLRKARAELEAKETLLRTVIDQIPDILLVKNRDGRFVMVNRTLADFYDTTPEAMVGKDDSDFGVSEAMSEAHRQNVLEIMSEGVMRVVYEESRNAATGEIHHFKSLKKPFKNAEDAQQILVVAHDITDEIRTQEELQRQRALLKTLIQTIPDLVWLKDQDGIYLACNHRFEAFFGAKEEEIVGKSDYDFVEKELADFFRHHDLKAMHRGGPSVNEERITFKSDGHEELLETIKTPMHDDKGTLIGVLGIGRDITEQKQRDLEIREKLQKIIDLQNSIVILTDATELRFVNEKFLEFFGYESIEAFKATYGCICERFIGHEHFFHLGKIKENESNWIDSIMNLTGRERIVSMLSDESVPHAFSVSVGRFDDAMYIVNFSDISDTMIEKLQLERQANLDELTRTHNRAYFHHNIAACLRQRHKHHTGTGIIFLDIDHFKAINDTYGHDTGDEVLKEIAQLLKQHIRDLDRLIRWGGEEFVIVTEATLLKQVHQQAENLRTIISHHSFEQVKGHLTCSFGCALYADDEEIDATLKRADEAMYRAKADGRNLVRSL